MESNIADALKEALTNEDSPDDPKLPVSDKFVRQCCAFMEHSTPARIDLKIMTGGQISAKTHYSKEVSLLDNQDYYLILFDCTGALHPQTRAFNSQTGNDQQ
jgi:hypothetical protein